MVAAATSNVPVPNSFHPSFAEIFIRVFVREVYSNLKF
jgi:hypothetical protein